jgi:hypothetical protein
MKKLLLTFGICVLSLISFAQQKNLQEYAGTFKFSSAPFEKITITLEDAILLADAEGIGKGEINATDKPDEFGEPNNQAILKFGRDGNGKIFKLEVSAQGMTFLGEKMAADLNSYVGEYALKENSSLDKFVVVLKDGILSVDTNIGSSDLVPTDDADIFQLKSVDGKVGFTRDSSGKIVSVNVIAMGILLEGTKK